MIVAYRNGNPVRLEQLGNVLDSVQNDKVAGWYNDTRAIVLAIQRQPGANTVAVVDNIKKLLPQFREEIPAAVNLDVLFDRSCNPSASRCTDVEDTLFLAVCLVVLVIFLFLRNLSATLIPSLALPMSIIGTFAVMALLGYSLDNLSLMALTLCVGFVVDDAIVMLENIVRHMENGEPPMEAALKGSKEIGFTIISMTLSLTAVFIPVLFMSGLLGRLLHEFAVTIVVAVLVSGFVSLTLTPMMCSRFVHSEHERKHGQALQCLRAVLRPAARRLRPHACKRSCAIAARRCWFRWPFSSRRRFLFVRDSARAFSPTKTPARFSPPPRRRRTFPLTRCAQHQLEAMKIVAADPNVDGFMSAIGAAAVRHVEQRPHVHAFEGPLRTQIERRTRSSRNCARNSRKCPASTCIMQNPPLIRVGGMLTKALYQYSLQDTDMKELFHWAPILMDKMAAAAAAFRT